jgi:Spy/CpxP family protein refolding chaperone
MTCKALPVSLTLLLTGSLALVPMTSAQQPQAAASDPSLALSAAPAHAPDPHRQAVRMARELSLTPVQTAKLEPILADRDRKIAAVRADSSLDPKTAHKQIHALQHSAQQQLSTVLTPDQITQLKALQQSRQGKRQSAPQAQPLTAPAA